MPPQLFARLAAFCALRRSALCDGTGVPPHEPPEATPLPVTFPAMFLRQGRKSPQGSQLVSHSRKVAAENFRFIVAESRPESRKTSGAFS